MARLRHRHIGVESGIGLRNRSVESAGDHRRSACSGMDYPERLKFHEPFGRCRFVPGTDAAFDDRSPTIDEAGARSGAVDPAGRAPAVSGRPDARRCRGRLHVRWRERVPGPQGRYGRRTASAHRSADRVLTGITRWRDAGNQRIGASAHDRWRGGVGDDQRSRHDQRSRARDGARTVPSHRRPGHRPPRLRRTPRPPDPRPPGRR